MEIHTVSHYGQVYNSLPHLIDKLCISYLLTTHCTNETQLGV